MDHGRFRFNGILLEECSTVISKEVVNSNGKEVVGSNGKEAVGSNVVVYSIFPARGLSKAVALCSFNAETADNAFDFSRRKRARTPTSSTKIAS